MEIETETDSKIKFLYLMKNFRLRLCIVLLLRQVLGVGSNLRPSCNQVFDSSISKSGSFSSPNHPGHYPSGMDCQYLFRGDARERVRIRFSYIDLFYTAGDSSNPLECKDQDSIIVETGLSPPGGADVDTRFVNIGSYCGSKLPPNIMSSNNVLRIAFKSLEHSIATGFNASYAFVTNYGITIGQQDLSKACRFVIRSSGTRNGTIESPNYPGLYPRNTECGYEFRGREDERVSVSFRFIDVDGIPPDCKLSKSDYIELENLVESSANTHVTESPRRLCGLWDMRYTTASAGPDLINIRSSTNWFLVTLKSNDVLDGRGFEAFFQFEKNVQEITDLPIPNSAGSYMEVAGLQIIIIIINILAVL